MSMITKMSALIVTASLGSALFAADATVDSDKADAFAKLPKAVQATIEKEANGAKVTDVDTHTKDGRNTYEAELKQGDKKWEVCVAEDGTIVKDYKHDGEIDKVPTKVKTALLKEAKTDQIQDIDRETKDGRVFYEAKIKTADGSRKVCVNEEGEVVKDR